MDIVDKKHFLLGLVATLILTVTVLMACTSSPAKPQPEPTSPVVISPQEVQRVTPEEGKTAFDSGAATFVDVRSQSSYAANHIPGALSIPLIEIEERIDELDPKQWIITYCT